MAEPGDPSVRLVGDKGAASAEAASYRTLLLSLIVKLHGVPPRDAEDVLQNAYGKFLRSLDSNRVKHVKGFLKKAAECESIDYHRKRVVEARAIQSFTFNQSVEGTVEIYPEGGMDAMIDFRKVLKVSKGRCREIFLRVILGKTFAECAEGMGVPRGTIGTTFARCVEKARRLLVTGWEKAKNSDAN